MVDMVGFGRRGGRIMGMVCLVWTLLAPALVTAAMPDGLELEAVLTVDAMSNRTGGLAEGSEVMSNLDLVMAMDLEQLCGWTGGSALVYLLADYGRGINERVGSLQGVSNIEAAPEARVYELWLNQRLWDDRLSLRFGLYDLNSEFDAIDTASLFINPSHGIGPDFSQSGGNGPSIFPYTSLALRAQVEAGARTSLRAMVADGVPGDPSSSAGTDIRFRRGDGVLAAVEADLDLGRDGALRRIGVGVWGYSESSEEGPVGEAIAPRRNRGLYLLGEAAVDRGPFAGSAWFVRLGGADERVNVIDLYLGLGGVKRDLWTDGDRLGLAVAAAHIGDHYRRAVAEDGGSADSSEVILELTYLWPVLEWLELQPDLQYVIHPGADSALDDALVVGLRAVLSFGLN